VAKYSQAEEAGLMEGDVVVSWSRGDARGQVQSPFDIAAIEIEQAPRGTVTLAGFHDKESKVWSLGQKSWGIQARPNFSGALLPVYLEGQALALAGKRKEAAIKWRSIVDPAETDLPAWLRPWLFFHVGQAQAEARHWEETDAAYREAIQNAAGAEPALQAQLLRARASAFEQQSIWTEAERYYQEAAAKEESAQDRLSRAVDMDNLGNVASTRGDYPRAIDYYLQSFHIREELAPGGLAFVLSLNHLGWVEQARGNLAKAEDYCSQALSIGNKLAPGSLYVGESLMQLGLVDLDRGHLPQAEEKFRQALAIEEKLEPESLDVSVTLIDIGRVAARRGDQDKAEALYRRALEIRQRLAPASLAVASSLHLLGLADWERGDLNQAEEYFKQSLEIRQKLAPGSMSVSYSLNGLGIIAGDRGDLSKAEEYYRQVLEIRERIAPGSTWVAQVLGNLGVTAEDRGDLVKAEGYYRQALDIKERLAPGSLDVALTLFNLGNVAKNRDDLVKAEEYYRQSLAIRTKQAPGSLDASISLGSLGVVAETRGDLDKAEEYYRKALEIKEKVVPNSVYLARTLHSLASLYSRRKDLGKAEEYFRRSLAIQEKVVPLSTGVAADLTMLSEVLQKRDHLDEAEQYGRRALALWTQLAPASADEARAFAGLASIMREQGKLDAAAQFYEQAIDALDAQISRLGGTEEVHAGFQAERGSYYRDYMSLLIGQGKADLAFYVLERSRARTLLEMLTSTHLDVKRGADPALLHRERALRENLTARVDRRIRLLTNKHTDEQIAEVDREIAGLREEYQAVEAEIRATSPGYASLTQPQPVNATQVQQLLDVDTVLVEYSLGAQHSYVFAVTQDSVAVHELAPRAEIDGLARRVYDALTARNRVIKGETPDRRQARWLDADKAYARFSIQLSKMVLGPVAAEIQCKRLLFVSDGALEYIPFAALPEPSDVASKETPLMVAHEVVNLPSASVLALLRRQENNHGLASKMVAVLADPVFSARDGRLASRSEHHRPQASKSLGDQTLTRSVSDVGLLELSRLPFSRREAEAIMSLTPPGKAMEALGFQATRAAATSPSLAQFRIVHFATHGLLDSQHPELSGLVFSLVDKAGKSQPGFLSVENIYNLDLPADLVVLSACESGLGKQISGEGLIGLTRAFMYAGASRVVASLWSVNDAATAELMAKFYKGMLRDGMSPAAALRQAQAQMLKTARWKSPYFWAAFQIQGEWK
jgi:CHAT domain-containing protein/tetratricopeptide (TPR) repeat protein